MFGASPGKITHLPASSTNAECTTLPPNQSTTLYDAVGLWVDRPVGWFSPPKGEVPPFGFRSLAGFRKRSMAGKRPNRRWAKASLVPIKP